MKRKFDEGIKILMQIGSNIAGVDFLEPLIYKYRAYGYFCMSNYEVKDLSLLIMKKKKIVNYLQKSKSIFIVLKISL